MVKESKNIDFYTTGRQPLEQDFARISEWIKKDKQKQASRKQVKQSDRQESVTHYSVAKSAIEDRS